MKLDFIQRYLSKKFGKLGTRVAIYPSYFIIIPVFISIVLATGFQKWHEKHNLKYLLAPDNTRHIKEEAVIAKLFPMNLSSNANMERMNREPCLATVLITAKDKGSILRQNIFEEILLLDKIIQNITVTERKQLKYEDLCAKNNKKCFENFILPIRENIEKIKDGIYLIKYPLSRKDNYDFHLSSLFLGGVEIDEDSNIKSAKALKLYYYLNDDSTFQKQIAEEWLLLFLDTLASATFKYINVDRYTTLSVELELGKVVHKILPRMSLAIVALLLFSMLTCIYNNWIESKPWIGAIALTSSGMALASSFGLVMYFNVPFMSSAGAAPFLILGIGMDDAFVFLAAWRKTDKKHTVSDRMGEVYCESAISVTITSVTNFIAFVSGLFTPFRAVRYFCLYASTAIVFCYIYQLTFVGACLAICGYLEKNKRHSLIFTQLKEAHDFQTWFPRIIRKRDVSEENADSVKTPWIYLGNILSLWYIKAIVLIFMSCNMAVGFWGITQTNIYGESSQSSTSDSYFLKYYDNNYKYFYVYKNRFQIVINQEVNYADKNIQREIEEIFFELENKGIIKNLLTESWLRSYLEFLNNESMSSIVKAYNMSSTKDFITVLQRLFLRHPAAQRFRNDIAFNSENNAIAGSRFLCQTYITKDEKTDLTALKESRNIIDKAPFIAFPYIYYSYFVDETDLHVKFTIQMLSSVAVIIIIVYFIFIPDAITTFSVTFSVISTELCALGYMALWKVELAPVSLIVLVMCAGFSVDYSSHFSYVYMENKSIDPNQRLRDSINSIGLAIFQGGFTTIISIVPLAFPLAYIFIALFKVIFLVTLFSIINALVFLPVILTILYNVKSCSKRKKMNVSITDSKDTGNINSGFQLSDVDR